MINWGCNLAGLGMGGANDGYHRHGDYYGLGGNDDYRKNTAAELDYCADHGFDYLRLQCMWYRLQHELASDGGGALDATDVGYLNDVITLATARGLHVSICPFDYAKYYRVSTDEFYDIGDANCPYSDFADFWSRMATEFQGKVWAYDLMNEPNSFNLVGAGVWFAACQAAITAIRAVDTTTPIIVPGDGGSSITGWYESGNDALKDLVGSNLIFEGHQYFDFDTQGTYPYPTPGDSIPGYTGELKDRAEPLLAPFVKWCRANGKVGLIGEMNTPGTNFWMEVLRPACDYLEQCDDVIQYVQIQSGWTYPWKDGYNQSFFPLSSPGGQDNVLGAERAQTVMLYTDHVGHEYTGIVPKTVVAITENGNWECPAGVTNIQLLLVGGGAGGGYGVGGGGGAGGVCYKASHPVTPGATYAAVIGAGGAAKSSNGQGNDGANTTFMGFTALGGGGGGCWEDPVLGVSNGRTGASGGGGGNFNTGDGGVGTQGHDGGDAGILSAGGGGAGDEGFNDIYNSAECFAPGGSGLDYSDIFGTVYGVSGFFGGGGGGCATANANGIGGKGGGGNGSIGTVAEGCTYATAGTANTGGGGGGSYSGGGENTGPSGAGGSGVVLIGYGGDVAATGMSTLTGISSLTIA